MNNSYKRKRKIAPVPDFYGNTDDTIETKTNKYVSNINVSIDLSNKK